LKSSSRERHLWGALLVLALLATPSANARSRHSDAWAREHFAAAERMREALNGRAPADRTRHSYQRVIDAYRAIYLGAPNSSKADPSVVAVAEMLVEMGRRFEDDKILNKAIAQYKFLRKEYPGSKYRADGLFTVAEIYKDDLNDLEAAKVAFEEFLHRYPHNRLADDARQAIAELNQPAGKDKAAGSAAQTASGSPSKGAKPDREPLPVNSEDHATATPAKAESTAPHSGHLPRVTGIRHWSTPDYTRVAIDVEGDIKFSSQRIARPSRIFFDLSGTKLASTLVGKSFDVDDGFLKKVRVAQFAPGRTRVVLEVDNLSDYDAFLLPNPYRLIIDLHGKQGRPKPRAEADESLASNATDSSTPPESPQSDPESSTSKNSESLSPREGESATSSTLESNVRALAAGSKVSTVTTKTKSGVVKTIVEADDDEGGENSPSEPAKMAHSAKKQPRAAVVVPKKVIEKNLAEDSADDATADDASKPAPGSSESKRRTASSARRSGESNLDVHEAKPTSNGDRSLIRALGLKIGRIVIDPGHGGHDTGTIGPNGLREKDLVLEVGRRLGKLLETRLGAEVVYTRRDDTFIPLETRTAIANQARADLFISIHANSSHDPAARGVETYYLNFTSSPEALEVAARENAVSEKSIYELQDLVKKIAMKEKIDESREFAGDVQASLHNGLAAKSPAIRDRGVKKAPFIVLIGANMPSILAEISFVSNPADEHRLATSEYRERIAESLYRGIAKYANGLSGVKVASKMDKGAGQ
jgi:N-acetylmuramoyl-L-alanine amidase